MGQLRNDPPSSVYNSPLFSLAVTSCSASFPQTCNLLERRCLGSSSELSQKQRAAKWCQDQRRVCFILKWAQQRQTRGFLQGLAWARLALWSWGSLDKQP